MLRNFQIPSSRGLDYRDHIWQKQGVIWKCLRCGAITKNPPPYPTPDDWVAEFYDTLNEEERDLVRHSDASPR